MLGEEKAVSNVALLLGVMLVTVGLAAAAVRLAGYEAPAPPESPLLASSEKDDEDECGSERGEAEREAQMPSAPSNQSAVGSQSGPPCRLR